MRKQHEKPTGVICEHCGKLAIKPGYKRINTLVPKPNDTTGKYVTIDRYNLCTSCYDEYTNILKNFFTPS